jgi:hypothetical protein
MTADSLQKQDQGADSRRFRKGQYADRRLDHENSLYRASKREREGTRGEAVGRVRVVQARSRNAATRPLCFDQREAISNAIACRTLALPIAPQWEG